MKIENSVGIFDNVLNTDECKKIIDQYNLLAGLNLSFNRIDLGSFDSHRIKDNAVFLLEEKSMRLLPTMDFLETFLNKFWNCYKQYTDHYSVIKEAGNHYIRSMKLQKTLPGEGYHIWHFENDSAEKCSRLCAWGLYLNTINDGGETEFLYQSMRVSALEGRLILWPATYTHTHRGNPPLKGVKYLLTGWLEY